MKRLFVIVEHAFEDREEAFVGDSDLREGVDDPFGWTDVALLGEGVLLEEGDEIGDGEHRFAEVETGAETADLFGYDFVGFGCICVAGCGALEGFGVDVVDELVPG